MLPVGTILRGTYRVDGYLSSGGFGNTYVVTNVEFDERYAIKEFFMRGVTQRDEGQSSVSVSNSANRNSFEEQREKFKKEARRLRQLSNSHVVRVHDLFDENGTSYYVMDFIDGESLSDRLKRTGQPIPESEVRNYLLQILDGLEEIHNKNFQHLDLKPANIMVDKKGHITIIDFGASKQMRPDGGATASTAICYTPGYAPREQMEQNYEKFGPWTDLYALGATLYNILTNNKPPLPSDIDDEGEAAFSFPTSISNEMRSYILWLMQPNRMKRPQKVMKPTWKAEETKVAKKEPKSSTPSDPSGDETIVENPQKKSSGTIKVIRQYSNDTPLHLCKSEEKSTNNELILKNIARNLNSNYEYIFGFREGMSQVIFKGKLGYINKKGEEIIPCKYENTINNDFHDGIALVKRDGKYGFINKSGNEVIPVKYDDACPFSEGYALVKLNTKYGYIDINNKTIIPFVYDDAKSFSKGLAAVAVKDDNGNKKYGFIDQSGNIRIPFIYADAQCFSQNGLAIVGKWKSFMFLKHLLIKYGCIDMNGKEIVPFNYGNIWGFGNNKTTIVINNNKYGFIDNYGNEIISCKYEEAYSSLDELAPVYKNGKWGFIDIKGRMIVPFKYFKAYPMKNGMAAVQGLNYLWGFINIEGKEIIPCKYRAVHSSFEEGMAGVQGGNNLWGFIDKNAKEVIPCIYDWIHAFEEGLSVVKKGLRIGFVDKTGKSTFDY